MSRGRPDSVLAKTPILTAGAGCARRRQGPLPLLSAQQDRRAHAAVRARPHDELTGSAQVALLHEEPEGKRGREGERRKRVDTTAHESVHRACARPLARGEPREIGLFREPLLTDLHGQRGQAPAAAVQLVEDPHVVAHGDAARNASHHVQVANHPFGEPPADDHESEHGAQQEIEQVVARVHRRETDREASDREDDPTRSEAYASPCSKSGPCSPENLMGRAERRSDSVEQPPHRRQRLFVGGQPGEGP